MKRDEVIGKSTGFLIGLNVALVLVLLVFNFKVKKVTASILAHTPHFDSVFVLPPITQFKKQPPEKILKNDKIDSENEEIKISETDTKPVTKTEFIVKSDSLLWIPSIVDGKKAEIIETPNTIADNLDEEAFFNGGTSLLHQFFQRQFNKPRVAQEMGVNGTVLLIFIVEKDGAISNIGFLDGKGRQLGYGIEQEVERVIKLTSGSWTPGKINGKAVRSYWRFPIEIRSNDGW